MVFSCFKQYIGYGIIKFGVEKALTQVFYPLSIY